jgi:hypothetical protein
MRKIILSVLCISLGFTLTGQDAKLDFVAINKAMGAETYAANIEYKSYIDKTIAETMKSNIVVSKSLYKITIGDVTKINSDKLNLTLDHANDLIVVAKTEKISEKLRQLPPLDSFLGRAESIKFSKKGQIGTYFFILKGFREKMVEIDFDLSSFQIKRIYTVMTEKLIDEQQQEHEKSFEITYLSYNKDIPIDHSVFNTGLYIVKKSKTFITTAKYSKYKIIDMIYNKE